MKRFPVDGCPVFAERGVETDACGARGPDGKEASSPSSAPGAAAFDVHGWLREFPEWQLTLQLDPEIDDGRHYLADLQREGEWVCRIRVDGSFADREEAGRVLILRMRQWLIGYEELPATGDSGFQLL